MRFALVLAAVLAFPTLGLAAQVPDQVIKIDDPDIIKGDRKTPDDPISAAKRPNFPRSFHVREGFEEKVIRSVSSL